ncbi:MAG TPA: ParB N-terminal domain-containing protein [Thermodesulfobacteriota bacterium]|nr:ParB N-terminal domain-containing protein [Thermodesulfobacteriota bacterium]
MIVKEIEISDIDISNPKYLILYNNISNELFNSIKSIGIINPPIIVKSDNKYIVLTGFKRFSVCKELGLKTVLCKVIDENEISFDKCIKIIYEDNRDRFTDIEIGQLCKKYIYHGNDVKKFLELIGYPTSEKNIQRFTYLSNLNERILEYYIEERLNPEQCFLLSQINTENALLILNKVLLPFRFNTNETREFLTELNDISIRDDISIAHIIENTLKSQEKINKNDIRLCIKKLRSPKLIEVEKEYHKIIKSLKLPKSVQISYSPYFESNYIEVKAKIDGKDKLNELKTFIGNEDSFKRLIELISLVRGERN